MVSVFKLSGEVVFPINPKELICIKPAASNRLVLQNLLWRKIVTSHYLDCRATLTNSSFFFCFPRNVICTQQQTRKMY